jgi:hypothetical protein
VFTVTNPLPIQQITVVSGLPSTTTATPASALTLQLSSVVAGAVTLSLSCTGGAGGSSALTGTTTFSSSASQSITITPVAPVAPSVGSTYSCTWSKSGAKSAMYLAPAAFSFFVGQQITFSVEPVGALPTLYAGAVQNFKLVPSMCLGAAMLRASCATVGSTDPVDTGLVRFVASTVGGTTTVTMGVTASDTVTFTASSLFATFTYTAPAAIAASSLALPEITCSFAWASAPQSDMAWRLPEPLIFQPVRPVFFVLSEIPALSSGVPTTVQVTPSATPAPGGVTVTLSCASTLSRGTVTASPSKLYFREGSLAPQSVTLIPVLNGTVDSFRDVGVCTLSIQASSASAWSSPAAPEFLGVAQNYIMGVQASVSLNGLTNGVLTLADKCSPSTALSLTPSTPPLNALSRVNIACNTMCAGVPCLTVQDNANIYLNDKSTAPVVLKLTPAGKDAYVTCTWAPVDSQWAVGAGVPTTFAVRIGTVLRLAASGGPVYFMPNGQASLTLTLASELPQGRAIQVTPSCQGGSVSGSVVIVGPAVSASFIVTVGDGTGLGGVAPVCTYSIDTTANFEASNFEPIVPSMLTIARANTRETAMVGPPLIQFGTTVTVRVTPSSTILQTLIVSLQCTEGLLAGPASITLPAATQPNQPPATAAFRVSVLDSPTNATSGMASCQAVYSGPGAALMVPPPAQAMQLTSDFVPGNDISSSSSSGSDGPVEPAGGDTDSSSGVPIAIIAGCIIGLVVLVAIIGGVCWWHRRRASSGFKAKQNVDNIKSRMTDEGIPMSDVEHNNPLHNQV